MKADKLWNEKEKTRDEILDIFNEIFKKIHSSKKAISKKEILNYRKKIMPLYKKYKTQAKTWVEIC